MQSVRSTVLSAVATAAFATSAYATTYVIQAKQQGHDTWTEPRN